MTSETTGHLTRLERRNRPFQALISNLGGRFKITPRFVRANRVFRRATEAWIMP
jgi:hypothetical protein